MNPHLTRSEATLLIGAIIAAILLSRGMIWLVVWHPWIAAMVIGPVLLFVLFCIFE